MATEYAYTISTDTPNGKVNIDQLTYEIAQNAGIGIPLSWMDTGVVPDKLGVYMSVPLDAGQHAALTATVAAHQGFGVNASMKGTLQLVHKELTVVSDVAWEVLGGVLTTPNFFDPEMSTILCRIIGEHRGDGGQLRLAEETTGQLDEEKITPFFDFPDTAGTWQKFKIDSNVPPRDALRNVYRTDVRRNGAVSLELRYSTVSMIIAKVV
jgi:hypothetical protein